MDTGDVLMMIFSGFLGYGIPLLFWIGTLVFGVIMLRRGGGRPEGIFITGAGLNILGTLLRILTMYLPIWLSVSHSDIDNYRNISFTAGLVIDVIGAAGILCLIYAFWLKFNGQKSEKPVSGEAES